MQYFYFCKATGQFRQLNHRFERRINFILLSPSLTGNLYQNSLVAEGTIALFPSDNLDAIVHN
ncbi:MAG TPA: hypothetical protein V6D28_20605 [Leptolyngbyaceae cyanobacterium]